MRPAAGTGPLSSAGIARSVNSSSSRPEFARNPVQARLLGEYAALTPLAGPAALVTALASDALRLRRVLDEALSDLG